METVSLGRASGCSKKPNWTRNDVLDLQRAISMKTSEKRERSATRRRWERDWRELVRFGLLMRRMDLDWTLSRRWREDLGHHPRYGSRTQEKVESEIFIYLIDEWVRNIHGS